MIAYLSKATLSQNRSFVGEHEASSNETDDKTTTMTAKIFDMASLNPTNQPHMTNHFGN